MKEDLIPRLTPIEEPDNWIVKAAYLASKKMFGKAITPMKVTDSRMPSLLNFSQKIQETESKLSIGNELPLLVKILTASINDCPFCGDIARFTAIKNGLNMKKFDKIMNFKESNEFSEKEKSALAYAEEVTIHGHMKDEIFDEVRKHYTEKEIIEITWMVSAETYYNKMNHAMNIGSDNLETGLEK